MANKYLSRSELAFVDPSKHDRFIDLTGQVFGRLTVLGFAGRRHWYVQCECGNLKKTSSSNLVRLAVRSCGCLHSEILGEKNKTHGLNRAPEVIAFNHAKDRCLNHRNRSFGLYGGRGIEFRFASFNEFFQEVGTRPSNRHSIDRINTNGHYEVGNVRWATHKQQCSNRRSNRFLTANNISMTMTQWSEKTAIPFSTIHSRIRRGWCESCSVSVPLGANRNACQHRKA